MGIICGRLRSNAPISDQQMYSHILESIFGANIPMIASTDDISNPILGALNSSQFKDFRTCFIRRLKQLNKIYKNDAINRIRLLTKIVEVASKTNWQGAYAEIVSLQNLMTDLTTRNNFLLSPIELDVVGSGPDTYAVEFGQIQINWDGKFREEDVYFDVKVFQDILNDQIGNILRRFEKKNSAASLAIMPEYGSDIDFLNNQHSIRLFIDELQSNINSRQKNNGFLSSAIPGLRIRLHWGKGVAVGESSWGPYEHANNVYRIAFKHAKKYHKKRPFFLVFCIFPWFNQKVSDFRGYNFFLYRSLARRVFMQYRNSSKLLNEIVPEFTANDTVWEVSKNLSGILFLEDKSIMPNNKHGSDAYGYFFTNPNANNPLQNRPILYQEYFRGLYEIDEFEFDNY